MLFYPLRLIASKRPFTDETGTPMQRPFNAAVSGIDSEYSRRSRHFSAPAIFGEEFNPGRHLYSFDDSKRSR